jgi:hypothetical protein
VALGEAAGAERACQRAADLKGRGAQHSAPAKTCMAHLGSWTGSAQGDVWVADAAKEGFVA